MIYYIRPDLNYLKQVVRHLTAKYDNLSNLRIIVSNATICSYLQQEFIKSSGADTILLPNIIPLKSIIVENEILEEMDIESVDYIRDLELKMLVARLIADYQHDLSMVRSVELATEFMPVINQLLDKTLVEFEKSDLADFSSYQQYQISLVSHLLNVLPKRLREINKVTIKHLLWSVFKQEKKSRGGKCTVFVGLLPDEESLPCDYLSLMLKDQGAEWILPPYIPLSSRDEGQISVMVNIDQLLIDMRADLSGLVEIKGESKNDGEKKIRLINFSDGNRELEYLTNKIFEIRGQSVALICNNEDLQLKFKHYLAHRGVKLNNMTGSDVKLTKAYENFIALPDLLVRNELAAYFVFLKKRGRYLGELDRLEVYLRKNRIFCDIENLHEKSGGLISEEAQNFIEQTLEDIRSFKQMLEFGGFQGILKKHIEIVSKYFPWLWSSSVGKVMSTKLQEMLVSNDFLGKIDNVNSYKQLIDVLFSGIKYFEQSDENVTILNSSDASLLFHDVIIIPELNDHVWPGSLTQSSSNRLLELWNIDEQAKRQSKLRYDFFTLIRRNKVFLTRTRKDKAVENIPSRFINLLGIEGEEGNCLSIKLDNFIRTDPVINIKNLCFDSPQKISATNIELLVRDPYAFYAKKILHLDELRELNDSYNVADYGSLVHAVIHEYNKNYQKNKGDRHDLFVNIASGIMDGYSALPRKDIWLNKIKKISTAFIAFDEERRKNTKGIYTEIYGEMDLEIAGRMLKITAIADRIELLKDGTVSIVDFKTGAVPSKLEVESGLSSQLIIEALIAFRGKYSDISINKIKNIEYIKVNSDGSFASTIIEINEDLLLRHLKGLTEILEKYLCQGASFSVNKNTTYAPRYNAYGHLERNEIS